MPERLKDYCVKYSEAKSKDKHFNSNKNFQSYFLSFKTPMRSVDTVASHSCSAANNSGLTFLVAKAPAAFTIYLLKRF
jgi:hypothetical protein